MAIDPYIARLLEYQARERPLAEARLVDKKRRMLLDKVIRKAYLKRRRNLRYRAKGKVLPIKPMRDYGDV